MRMFFSDNDTVDADRRKVGAVLRTVRGWHDGPRAIDAPRFSATLRALIEELEEIEDEESL